MTGRNKLIKNKQGSGQEYGQAIIENKGGLTQPARSAPAQTIRSLHPHTQQISKNFKSPAIFADINRKNNRHTTISIPAYLS